MFSPLSLFMSHVLIMFTLPALSMSSTLPPHYTHVICISIFCPHPNVSYDTLTTQEGAAQQDSSGAAAAQEVGTLWQLAGDGPHLWSVPKNPHFRPFGLFFQGLGKRGSNSQIHIKKRERSLWVNPIWNQTSSKSNQNKKCSAVTRRKAADPFREKGKENMGKPAGMGGSNSKLGWGAALGKRET